MKTEIRRDTAKEVDELQTALYAIYCMHKHFFVVPGNLTPDERAQWI